LDNVLDRQMVGLSRALGAASSLAAYLLSMCAPPFVLGRRNPYHPVWSGLECYAVYAAAAAAVGSICAAFASDGWRALGALVAGGEAWARVGSVALAVTAFLSAGFMGSRSASIRRSGVRGGRGSKGRSDEG
jgi:hypothetical protein